MPDALKTLISHPDYSISRQIIPVIFRKKHLLNCFKSSMDKFANITPALQPPNPSERKKKNPKNWTRNYKSADLSTLPVTSSGFFRFP